MAEAWARRLFPADWSVRSGGLLTYPITDDTREAMAEVGLDLAGQESKTFDQYDLDSFDLVVTLSKEAGAYLPPLAAPAKHLRRPVDDPMSARGTDDEIRAAFRQGRDRIKDIVEDLIKSSQD
jgi:arsenate reductase